MSGERVYELAWKALERYGYGTVLATAVLWFVRVDLVLPMVESHRQFLREMADSQREIAAAMREQTQLLYAVQAHLAKETSTKHN